METINSFFSYVSSPPPWSSHPPRPPSPPSEEPTTSLKNSSSRGSNSKTSLENNSKKVVYREFRQDSQDPGLLFRFMVYASGGTLPSEVKKVTRGAPKHQKNTANCVSSRQATQYSWVVQPQCRKKRRRSDNLENETVQAETGDIATHEVVACEEETHEEDIHGKDAHEKAFYEKSVPGKDSKKSVTFDMAANLPRKSALKVTLRDSAPAPRSWRPRFRLY
ncbi:uncharacterized protein TrAtP1_003870 [Trichoderma atroviride]|uniref:Uncharacterized protein n=1 Tax=Hypocrea atroviridis (strain ATCC 20476 / IMI 206040) TaxID=452589 RepID=G9P604_HYPAI|nr:uncharacterized protein TRIATDRAFT_32273 [Trichoderma atroviride IMI 206040]EHK40558.1 hypothetical protein TRIATDRAFT_32273 [Trichoderma atroviride IMI 206040]UKZ62629.1 hypothetical protein TrAtP1_003870 [Trichoderma atroviride]